MNNTSVNRLKPLGTVSSSGGGATDALSDLVIQTGPSIPGSQSAAAALLGGGGIRRMSPPDGAEPPKVGSPAWAKTLSDEPSPNLEASVDRLANQIGRAFGLVLEVGDQPIRLAKSLSSIGTYPVFIDGEKVGELDGSSSRRGHLVNASEREIARALTKIIVELV